MPLRRASATLRCHADMRYFRFTLIDYCFRYADITLSAAALPLLPYVRQLFHMLTLPLFDVTPFSPYAADAAMILLLPPATAITAMFIADTPRHAGYMLDTMMR